MALSSNLHNTLLMEFLSWFWTKMMFSGKCCPTLQVFVLPHKTLQTEIIVYIHVLVICTLRYLLHFSVAINIPGKVVWGDEVQFESPESNFHDSTYSMNGPVCLYRVLILHICQVGISGWSGHGLTSHSSSSRTYINSAINLSFIMVTTHLKQWLSH